MGGLNLADSHRADELLLAVEIFINVNAMVVQFGLILGPDDISVLQGNVVVKRAPA